MILAPSWGTGVLRATSARRSGVRPRWDGGALRCWPLVGSDRGERVPRRFQLSLSGRIRL
jgi:hypothetical protein